ncbi:MAG: DUF3298 domain-containing protein [Schwartzia sp.]|nr:DUF3298 domain-containing protein [Schwartzia sp. (in: firmicutes)]
MKKKLLCAAALCAALSINAVPIPRLLPPVAFAQSVETYEDASLRFLPLATRTRYVSDGDEKGELLRACWTSVGFAGKLGDFGNIARALSAYSEEEAQNFAAARAKLAADGAMDRAEREAQGGHYFGPYQDMRNVYVRRADSLAVSLLEYGSSYMGGVHGMYGVSGVSFDARTGKRLALSDVFTDLPALAEAIKQQLGFDYPDAPFRQSGGEGMRETVDQMVGDGSVRWVLEPRGVSFYFNPYVIGSYAEGIYTTMILFETYPELFKTETQGGVFSWRGPKAYAMELPRHLSVRLTASPKEDRIRVDGGTEGITILDAGIPFKDPYPVKDLRPTFVSLADGRRYLYVDCSQDGVRYETRVYDMNGSEPACLGTQPMTRLMTAPEDASERGWYTLTDPEDFYMTATEGSGFAPGTRLRCRVGSDGRIEVIEAEGSVG